MSRVAVVVLNYNGRDFLDQFLPSLIKYCAESRVIVADNASTDDSIDLLKDKFNDQIEIIELKKNHGFAGGYNEALEHVEAEFYGIINSDIEVKQDWITPLIDYLDGHPEVASVQPKIKSFHEPRKFEYAGACGGRLDQLGYPYCRGRIFDDCEEDVGQYNEPMTVSWTSGACLMIRSKDFWSVGGFDADFFAHMEEIDMCWRLNSTGRQLACVPASTVYHVGGGTLAKSSPRKTYLNIRNGLWMLIKNLPMDQWWKLPVRIGLDQVAGLKLAFSMGFKHYTSVCQAQFDALIQMSEMFAKRKATSKPESKMNKSLTSIVWEHFIKGRKRYSQLDQ